MTEDFAEAISSDNVPVHQDRRYPLLGDPETEGNPNFETHDDGKNNDDVDAELSNSDYQN